MNESNRAWFEEDTGYCGEPIEYGGQQFYADEPTGEYIEKEYTQALQAIGRREASLVQEQKAENEQACKDNGLDPSEESEWDDGVQRSQLSEERQAYYEAQAKELMASVYRVHDELLEKHLKSWTLRKPCTPENIRGLKSRYDKMQLCKLIIIRASLGADEEKKSQKRSRR